MNEDSSNGLRSFEIFLVFAALTALVGARKDSKRIAVNSALYYHALFPAGLFLASHITILDNRLSIGVYLLALGFIAAFGAVWRGESYRRCLSRHGRQSPRWYFANCVLLVICQSIVNVQQGILAEQAILSILSGTLFFIVLSFLVDMHKLSHGTTVVHIFLLACAALNISDINIGFHATSWTRSLALALAGATFGFASSVKPNLIDLSALDLACGSALFQVVYVSLQSSGQGRGERALDLLALGLCLAIGRMECDSDERSPPLNRHRIFVEKSKAAYLEEDEWVGTVGASTSLAVILFALAVHVFALISHEMLGSHDLLSSRSQLVGKAQNAFDLALSDTPWTPQAIAWPQIEVGSLFKHTPGATPEQEGKFPRKVGLLAIPAGKQAKSNVDKIVQVMEPHGLDVMIFHYDDADWSDLEWYSRAHSVRVKGVAKLWFAKRFLTKEVVSNYDYIFLWDDDVFFEEGHFDAARLISNLYKYNIQVAQPAVKNSDWWEIWPTGGKQVGRWVDFVETMCPIYSTKAWINCIQPSIQYHLSTGCGFDLSVFYPCAAQGFCRTALLEQDRMVHLNQQAMTASNKHSDGWSDMCINDLREGRKFEKAWCEQEPTRRPCRNGTTYTSFRKINERDRSNLECPAHQSEWPSALPVKWT